MSSSDKKPPFTVADIRRTFLEFFAARGHTVVESSPLVPGDILVMWTDGIPEYACSRLEAATSCRDASDIAKKLITDLARPYDDAGCLVFKWQR